MNGDYIETGLWFGVPIGILTFIGVWIGATGSFGALGFLFGWMPAMIIGYIIGGLSVLLWPVIALGLAALFILFVRQL
jgi:hypothetical protein